MTRRELSAEALAAIDAISVARDRDHMQPTIDAFEALLAADPEQPVLLYEVGGAYDTAGNEARALGYYEQALALGLDGDTLRRCLMQCGSTLRNLDRFDESVAMLAEARGRFPESPAVRVFLALSLHAAGRSDAAVGELMTLIADELHVPDLTRYEASIRGNAEYLAELDAEGHPSDV